jgi:adenine-specific DNA-methyltransferase
MDDIRCYMDEARLAAGVSRKQIDQACGCQMTSHWFDKSQWSFPSPVHYQTMNALFGGALKPYEQLKAEYQAIKPQTRHFAVTKHVPYTNVWDFKPVPWYQGKHPCEKPLELMRHIIEASSRPGETVLDTFAGSGSTAMACLELGRTFVGCEMGLREFEITVKRLNDRSGCRIDPRN